MYCTILVFCCKFLLGILCIQFGVEYLHYKLTRLLREKIQSTNTKKDTCVTENKREIRTSNSQREQIKNESR